MTTVAQIRPGTVPDDRSTLDQVRRTVRSVLEDSPAFAQAEPELRKRLASKMVGVSMLAADQIAEDVRLSEASGGSPVPPDARNDADAGTGGLVEAQAAGDQLGLQATREAGRTLQAIREGIDFPNFVTQLITGVFQAISTSTIQQLEAISDLLDNVSASSGEFATSNINDEQAIGWIVGQLPNLLTAVPGESGGPRLLRVRDGQDLAESTERIKTILDATQEQIDNLDEDALNETLLPMVKLKMGRQRQANLSTMVMMGLQRIVVDQGRLHASMDMRVDTRSASEQATRQRDDFRVSTAASANFSAGMWGASATMSASVGRVRDDQQHTTEEIASQAGLRSSVDLVFHSEPIHLEQMVDPQRRNSILANSRVPEATWPASGQSLISRDNRLTMANDFGEVPALPTAPTAPTPPAARSGTTAAT